MSIKLKQPTMQLQLATLFFFLLNLVMRWNGHVFFNSLNKMTNAAYENAMRRCLSPTSDATRVFYVVIFPL